MANSNPKKKFKKGDKKPPTSGIKKGYKYPHTIVRDIINDCVKSGTYKDIESLRGIVLETIVARGLIKTTHTKGDRTALELAKWMLEHSNFFGEVVPEKEVNGVDPNGLISGNNIQMLYFSNKPQQEIIAGQTLQPDKQVKNGSATVLQQPPK